MLEGACCDLMPGQRDQKTAFHLPEMILMLSRDAACRMMEDALKAMLTSLPLVAELHHPSMRERHWRQLMQAS